MACLYSHSAQISILLRGHSFKGCFCLHLGKNIAMVFSKYFYFCLARKVLSCEANELKMLVLKFSNIFPNSTWETPPDVVLDAL